MSKSGVVLVHAHPLFRQGLRYHLSGHPEFRITGEAGNGQQAIQLVDYTDPDIVLIEMDLPGVNGLEVARAIKRSHPNVGVILLSADMDHQMMIRALRAGVAADHAGCWSSRAGCYNARAGRCSTRAGWSGDPAGCESAPAGHRPGGATPAARTATEQGAAVRPGD